MHLFFQPFGRNKFILITSILLKEGGQRRLSEYIRKKLRRSDPQLLAYTAHHIAKVSPLAEAEGIELSKSEQALVQRMDLVEFLKSVPLK